MDIAFLKKLNVGLPLSRNIVRVPEGIYVRSGDNIKAKHPNPQGYQNKSVTLPSSLEPEIEEVYVHEIGHMMYMNLRKDIPTRLQKFKSYLELISHDRFFSTEYTLPGSYWVNMFHGLNPKHLNYVHKLTQQGIDGITVEEIVSYKETEEGGILMFNSKIPPVHYSQVIKRRMAKDPLLKHFANYLTQLRKDEFTSSLVLRGPFSFELVIHSGDNKYISFVFTVQPLPNQDSCKLYVDFYSNIGVPQFLNWFVFHLVTPIVALEDVGYLKRLQAATQQRPELFKKGHKSVHSHHFLRLHQRFLELYGPHHI